MHAGFAAGPDAGADGRQFASRGAALMVLDILTDPDARVPGFGVETPFDFPFPVAVKTGTSHRFTDNWAVGVTGGFTVAVWVGNFSGRPMRRVSGVTGAGPLLYRAVMAVARRYEPGVLPTPADVGATRARVCRLSGQLAGADCPGTLEWFLPGTEPRSSCDWHRPGGVVLPEEYAEWASSLPQGVVAGGPAPGGATLAASASALRIVAPQTGDRYDIPPGTDPRYATIALRAVGAAEDEPLNWYVDGQRLASARWVLRPGAHVVRVVGASGRVAEAQFVVR
jgi:penicillin-binding protein 1C